MKFWKEHTALRVSLISIFVICGIVLLIVGWKMTGKLSGLGIMLAGLALLLLALAIYNKPFETPKNK